MKKRYNTVIAAARYIGSCEVCRSVSHLVN